MLQLVAGEDGRGPWPDDVVPDIPGRLVTEAVEQLEGGRIEDGDLIGTLIGRHSVCMSWPARAA